VTLVYTASGTGGMAMAVRLVVTSRRIAGPDLLEERVNNGRHVCWVAAPGGTQMELIEKL